MLPTGKTESARPNTGNHQCPIWVGYLLASPLRRLFDNPKQQLQPFVEPGMTVIDVGCAMGFYTLPLARMVGPSGHVVALDVQEPMLSGLRRRARRKQLLEGIDVRLCTQDDLRISDLHGRVDFALAYFAIHEMSDPGPMLHQLHQALRPGGKLLVAEPVKHVSAKDMDLIFALISQVGFVER